MIRSLEGDFGGLKWLKEARIRLDAYKGFSMEVGVRLVYKLGHCLVVQFDMNWWELFMLAPFITCFSNSWIKVFDR